MRSPWYKLTSSSKRFLSDNSRHARIRILSCCTTTSQISRYSCIVDKQRSILHQYKSRNEYTRTNVHSWAELEDAHCGQVATEWNWCHHIQYGLKQKKSHCVNSCWNHRNALFEFNSRIPLVCSRSQLVVHCTEKTSRSVSCPTVLAMRESPIHHNASIWCIK